MPPETLAVADPPTAQVAEELTEMETVGAVVEPCMVTDAVAVQPPASVTVTEWLPVERLVAVAVDWLLSQ